MDFKLKIDLIQNTFKLSLTQLSYLFNIKKREIYDWFDNTPPNEKILFKIDIIVELIEESTFDLKYLKTVWSIPIDDESFISIFSNDTLDLNMKKLLIKEKLENLKERLNTNKNTKNRMYLGTAHISDICREVNHSQ